MQLSMYQPVSQDYHLALVSSVVWPGGLLRRASVVSGDRPPGLTKAPPGLKARLRANVATLVVVVLVLRWIRNLLDLTVPVSVEAMYAEPVAALEAAAAAVGKAREATLILNRRRPHPSVFFRAVIGDAIASQALIRWQGWSLPWRGACVRRSDQPPDSETSACCRVRSVQRNKNGRPTGICANIVATGF